MFQSLALCTSALMFMLSRDRLNMDLDQESLNLMLRLLGVDQQEDSYTTLSPPAERALKRNKDRVLEVYKEFLQQSGTKQDSIDTDCLSVSFNSYSTCLIKHCRFFSHLSVKLKLCRIFSHLSVTLKHCRFFSQ